jgi:hypothetical protein
MALLDNLLSGGLPTAGADQQEALLADLFRRLQSGQAQMDSATTTTPPMDSRAGMFSPSSAAARGMQMPTEAPPLENRQVQSAPQPGVPYQPPAPSVVPQDIAAKQAPVPTPAAPPQRQANFFDHLGALARGYNSGGLIGGIAEMGNAGRGVDDHNQTVRAIAQKIGDPEMAAMIGRDPTLTRAVVPMLFKQQLGGDMTDELREYTYDMKQRRDRGDQKLPTFSEWKSGLKAEDMKPPAGYEWMNPADRSKGLRAIPGGPGEKIPSDVAGKLAMMTMARDRIANTRKVFERDWSATDFGRYAAGNVPFVGDISALSGEVGVAARDIRTAIEAALRTMTGAAAPEQEVVRYLQMFMPGPKDTKETAKQKIDGLVKFMDEAERLVMRGHGGVPERPAAAPEQPAAPQRFKYNPATGALE